jgi:ribosomal protein S18 acetylase RimI-like enzyme
MRLIRSDDVESTIALMQRTGVHFVGSRAPRVLRAVARDAAAGSNGASIALAFAGETPIALVVAFTERARYWRTFPARHPIAALEIGLHRARQRIKKRTKLRPEGVEARFAEARSLIAERLAPMGPELWTDESPQISKVMFVAVDPAHRKGGVGHALYRWFFCDLSDRGVTRCDAHVSPDNVAAVTLHRRFPFHIHEIDGGYFLWLRTAEVSRT